MLLENREATLCKLNDRWYSVSSMAGIFFIEKLKAYIAETREYAIPPLRKAKEKFPADSHALFILKYRITSVIDSIDATLQAIEA